MVALGEIAEIIAGGTPKSAVDEYWYGEVPWATPKDLSKLIGPYLSATQRNLTAQGLANSSAKLLPANSVLFSSRAPIGHVAINAVPMATNQGFKNFVPREGVLDSKYLYHWLRANRSYLESLGNGATFKELSKAVVSKVELPLPPLLEQRRIATILDHAETLRVTRHEILDSLDKLTQSVFIDMFGDPIVNEKKLPVSRLDELIDKDRPLTYGILKPGPDQAAGGVKYVRVVDIQGGMVETSSVRSTTLEIAENYRRSRLISGDLLMSIRGHVGRFAVVPDELDGGNITQDTARLAIVGASRTYVQECISTVAFRRWLDRHTKGVAVQGINLGDVKQMPIPLPNRSDQECFARAIEQITSVKTQHRKALLESDALFSSLQSRAFRGEL